MLIVSKYQLDDADIFGWFAPRDKLGRIVIESIWCICTQLIIRVSVQNKTNIEISLGKRWIIIRSFTNTHHHKVNRLLKEHLKVKMQKITKSYLEFNFDNFWKIFIPRSIAPESLRIFIKHIMNFTTLIR